MSVPTENSELVPAVVEAEPAPAEAVQTGARWMRLLREVLETVLLTAIIYLAVNFATSRYRVEGDSMQPTMKPDQYVLVDKISYRLGEPQRGDIVVFRFPFSSQRDFIKRVVGLPGETVSITGGVVTVNGQPLAEPYVSAPPTYQGTWTLAPNEIFVLGDNRNNSSDSHSWGPLEEEFLEGRAVVVYWPPDAWSVVPHYRYDVGH